MLESVGKSIGEGGGGSGQGPRRVDAPVFGAEPDAAGVAPLAGGHVGVPGERGEADQIAWVGEDRDAAGHGHGVVGRVGRTALGVQAGSIRSHDEPFGAFPLQMIGFLDDRDTAAIGMAPVEVEPRTAGDGIPVQDVIGPLRILDVSPVVLVPAAHAFARCAQDGRGAMQAEVGRTVHGAYEMHVGRVVHQVPDGLAVLGECHVIPVGRRGQVALRIQVTINGILKCGDHVRADQLPNDAEAVLIQAGQGRLDIIIIEMIVVIGHGALRYGFVLRKFLRRALLYKPYDITRIVRAGIRTDVYGGLLKGQDFRFGFRPEGRYEPGARGSRGLQVIYGVADVDGFRR